ncbi:uncharacterized protein TrAtP1_000804 [Trichoderma atroviride]|uniref:uncharacterized protein n=1 Tax=Hypocrea atroviridis TaxID=63577 RepID=UPI003317C785|nr:hypothetical protein TrAtP1_000804 [Trichoderma atroviride]
MYNLEYEEGYITFNWIHPSCSAKTSLCGTRLYILKFGSDVRLLLDLRVSLASMNAVLLSIAALAQIGSSSPTGQTEPPIPELARRAPNTIWIWAGPNYTGPSQSLTYNTVNECHAINWDTIGSIWMPDNIVCTFTVKPGDCQDDIGNFRSQTIFPSGLADIRQWYEPRKADFPAYWFHNARSIQCGGANF